MMEWILTNWIPLALFGAAGLLSLGNRAWAALSAMGCCAAGVLAGLALGWTLEQLSVAVLVLCVLSFRPMLGKEAGDEL